MSSKPGHHLPQEIYHRIYWHAKRGIDPRVIAHTLKLPVRSVERIIAKLTSAPMEKTVKADEPETRAATGQLSSARPFEEFLDIFTFSKTRYTVIDFSGMIIKANVDKLDAEFKKLLASDLKAVALRMTDVKGIDPDGFASVVAFHEAFVKLHRHTAILDPSPEADAFLIAHDSGKKIPIFGTETAFEEKSFRS